MIRKHRNFITLHIRKFLLIHNGGSIIRNSNTINDESDYAYDMPSHKLGDAVFDENDMFENLFAAINVYTKLGGALISSFLSMRLKS